MPRARSFRARVWMLVLLASALVAAVWLSRGKRASDPAHASREVAEHPATARGASASAHLEPPSVAPVRGVDGAEDGFRLEGIVLEPDGSVAAGALVHLTGTLTLTSTADAGGGFSFKVPADTTGMIAAEKPGLASRPEAVEFYEDPALLTLQLEACGHVDLEIVDSKTRSPIADAIVHRNGPSFVEVHADAGGRARVSGVGMTGLSVSAPDYVEELVRVHFPTGAAASATVIHKRVALVRGVRVSGRVVDPAGRPVEGAEVWTGADFISDPVQSARDGSWFIEAVPPGRHSFEAHHETFASGRLDGVIVASTPIDGLSIALRQGVSISGRVVDSAGRGVPAAHVVAQSKPLSLEPARRVAESNADGEFELTGLPKTTLIVAARKGELAAEGKYVDSAAPPRGGVTLVMSEGRIEGLVIDARGVGVPRARVYASAYELEELSAAVLDDLQADGCETRSDATGRFALVGLPPGTWPLEAITKGAATRGPTQAKTGDLDVRLVVEAAAKIRGKVVDRGGHPIPTFTVSWDFAESPRADPGGAFEVEIPETQAFELRVQSPGMRTARVNVNPAEGQVTDVGTLVLVPGRKLSGVVRAADGSPVHGASVFVGKRLPGRLDRNEDLSTFDHVMLAVSSLDGAFSLQSIDDGALELFANHPERGRSPKRSLPDDAEDLAVELTLSATGTLEVRLDLRGRSPHLRYSIYLLSLDRLAGGSTAYCDAEQVCALENLVDGRHLVIPTMVGVGWMPTGTSGVEVRAGKTTRATLDLGPPGVPVVFETAHKEEVLSYLVAGNLEARTYAEMAGPKIRLLLVLEPSSDGKRRIEGLAAGPHTLCTFLAADRWVTPAPSSLVRCKTFTIPDRGRELRIEVLPP